MSASTQQAAFSLYPSFQGGPNLPALLPRNAAEPITVSATAATGTINYNVSEQSVLYFTATASANWTLNIRAGDGVRLDTFMKVGQVVTIAHMVAQGATAYYNNAVQIDGVAVTPLYQGGTAWTAGNASSTDVYTYTITKTAPGTFTVFASQTQFK